MKLLSIKPSTKADKKLMATFETDAGRKKTTHFGASGMDDFLISKNKEQRELYRTRHKKDLLTGDPSKAGFLSYYILWGDSTSKATNIASYKKQFNL